MKIDVDLVEFDIGEAFLQDRQVEARAAEGDDHRVVSDQIPKVLKVLAPKQPDVAVLIVQADQRDAVGRHAAIGLDVQVYAVGAELLVRPPGLLDSELSGEILMPALLECLQALGHRPVHGISIGRPVGEAVDSFEEVCPT